MGILNKFFGKKKNEQEYISNWSFYFSDVNDKFSSIGTDLNLHNIAPILNQFNVGYLSIKMKLPRENGLSSNEESETLWNIEDKIIKNLDSSNIKFTFTGRLTSNGIRDIYFYIDNTALFENIVHNSMGSFPTYEHIIEHKEDRNWSGYFDFLYPLPRQMQQIQNRNVLEQLEKGGDNLTKSREVFHWIYFYTEHDLNNYETYCLSKGFKVLVKTETDGTEEYSFVLEISRVDKVAYNEIDEYTLELWEKANDLNAQYDGWETSVEI